MKPVAIDLFCGLGGWADGFLAAGYDVIGFDIIARPYPGHLVLQDVATLSGWQFRHAAAIVASPPCQQYSYRSFPFRRCREAPPPDNSLFQACFRIQAEASQAAGRHIPMVVENVRGAERFVGPARWHYGSYYLWGDIPALMPIPLQRDGVKVGGINWSGSGKPGYKSEAFTNTAVARSRRGYRQGGWFYGNTKHQFRGIKAGEPLPVNYGDASRRVISAKLAKIPLPLAEHIANVFLTGVTQHDATHSRLDSPGVYRHA